MSNRRWVLRLFVFVLTLTTLASGLSNPVVQHLSSSAGLTQHAQAQAAPALEGGSQDIPPEAPGLATGATTPSWASAIIASQPAQASGVAPAIACDPAVSGQFQVCTYHEAQGLSLPFYLYLPAHYDATQRYPLVLLLHGGGERADAAKPADENRQKLLTDPYAAVWGPGLPDGTGPTIQSKWPSFVVVPQVTLPHRWVDIDPKTGSFAMPAQPTDELRMAKEIVDTLRSEYDTIDASRLYVTGMSIGGYGTWNAIERWPGYFAAAAPICGGGDPAHADRLTRLPIWAFHSADDPIVPVSGSRDMIAAIRAHGGDPRYTEYTNAGHGSWVRAYAIDGSPSPNLEFYNWFFAQRNPNPPTAIRTAVFKRYALPWSSDW